MNGAIVDEIGRRGAHNLVTSEQCAAHGGVGASRVVAVLYVLAMNADHRREVFWSLTSLAAELGIPVRDVRNALAALMDAGIIVLAGKRRRVNVYRLDPDTWPHEVHRDTRYRAPDAVAGSVVTLVDNREDRAGERAGDRAGDRAGKLAGYPATKGREVKSSSSASVADMLPSVFASVADDDTSEQELVRVALHGIAASPPPAWRRDVLAALERGWTASALNAHLHDRMRAVNGGTLHAGLARRIIREDEPPAAARRREPLPAWCGDCDEPTRMVERDDGKMTPCPRCSPKMVKSA